MNYGTFAGRLGRDADTKALPSGQSVTEFSLAVTTGWGERQSTLWLKCTLWGERGEKLAPYLKKGGAVTVSGDVDVRAYSAKDGTPKAEMSCNVQRVTLQGSAEAHAKPGTPAPAARTLSGTSKAEPDFDDDIPFG